MRPQTAHRHFGDVRERLADGTAEDEHAHLLVESGNVGVPYERLGALVQKIDPVALSNDDLKRTSETLTSGIVSLMVSTSHLHLDTVLTIKMYCSYFLRFYWESAILCDLFEYTTIL